MTGCGCPISSSVVRSQPEPIFGIVEEGTKFGLGGRGHASLDDGAVDMDGAIDRWRSAIGVRGFGVIFG